jgi:hypothetical protein
MVLIAHSRIFGILLKSILVMIQKDDLSLMIFSPIIQIQNIIEVRKQLFQRSKKQIINIRIPRLGRFSGIA